MKLAVLASGSQGNAILVSSGTHSILFDVGVSVRKLKSRAAELGVDFSGLKAAFISHEHSDHVRGLELFSEKSGLPVFATHGTLGSDAVRGIKNKVAIKSGETVRINGFEVQAFRLPHDAAEPVGFVISDREHLIAIATDLGSPITLVQERLKNAELVVLESNHDPELLRNGPYPWPLKQRILGRNGHLSNQDCAKTLARLQHHGLKRAVLAHLSDKNNRPQLAFRASREMVQESVRLDLTSQDCAGPLIEL
jgi:phosphoribosyl 1,2-cyclic phosphodiesterase